ncbi:cadherin-6-like [Amphiprion ocellaris]|uniref:cadherin-6-like n=1 Tax=Amphiprion ocellaris TaxID=80972 RepID=UPI0024115CF4|nr:cadherin-6-like [Amphiprion ocellaris]
MEIVHINNPWQISQVPVYIRVLDVNDNAPTFATNYETFMCENAKANQVGSYQTLGRRHVIVVLFAALRRQRKKKPLIISKEDVRDNVVNYNDEGGGKEDTQAFDIGTLRNPEAIEERKQRRDIVPETFYPPVRRPVLPPTQDNNGDVRDFINQRLQENDSDPTAPPYDSLSTYAYEGNGSVAESLNSLESVTTEGDQDYNYLSEWGPRFKKLADMYRGDDSDRDS